MAKPKEVLSSKDYTNYRNVRAAAVLFVVFGSLLVLGGIGLAIAVTEKKPDPKRDIPLAAAIGMAIVGLTGVVGGTATLRGIKRSAKLIYVMAVPYLFCFPIGTIIGYTILTGMPRYLDSKELIRQANKGEG